MAKGRSRTGKKQQEDRAEKNLLAGYALAAKLPLPVGATRIVRIHNNLCPKHGWAVVTSNGDIHVHPSRLADPADWCWVIAHCVLHLCLEHFQTTGEAVADNRWNIACDLFVARFLQDLGVAPPSDIGTEATLPAGDEDNLVTRMEYETPKGWLGWGTAGDFESDMVLEEKTRNRFRQVDWPAAFAEAIARSAREALTDVSGTNDESNRRDKTRAEQAMSWFISSYPLLGAMAVSFDLVEDIEACRNLDIQVAAVWPERKEIFLNPAVRLDRQELIFVIAHELLHVGLRHDIRSQGRDAYLWNVACDYVVNGWLVEMEVGRLPSIGALFDPALAGLSAEEIYDRLVADLSTMRRNARLATFGGRGKGDIISERSAAWWRSADGVSLDDFYRDALQRGLELHTARERGFIPANLVEEIRTLKQPAIPWDVKLADWFDEHFQPLERRRTYSRANRRQSATPDIPRPAWYVPQELHNGRTFAVVLDTSGSMDPSLLGKGLGAIASYAEARDVAAVRLVFCDASYHDQGYVAPTAIGDRVKIVGRGGTVLQPAITFLEQARDFPTSGPILVITDGACDVLRFKGARPRGYLLPEGARLPFKPKGDIFYMS